MPRDIWDRVSFSVTLFLIVFSPLAYGSVESWSQRVIAGGILLIAVAWFFRWRQRQAASLPKPPYFVGAALFFLLILFQLLPLPASWRDVLSPATAKKAVAFTEIPGIGEPTRVGYWTTVTVNPSATTASAVSLAGCLLFSLATYFSRLDRWKVKVLVLTLLALGVFEASYGLAEYWSGRQHIFWLRKSFYLEEVTGTYINHNHFAGLIEMILPLAVGLLIQHFSSRYSTSANASNSWKIMPGTERTALAILSGSIALMGTALILSRSRGGIVSQFLSLACLFYLLVKSRSHAVRVYKSLLIAVVLLCVMVIGLGREISNRFSYSVRDAPERFELWVDSLRIVQEFPWWGAGLGAYRDVLPNYRPGKDLIVVAGIPQPARVEYAHNDYLQMMVECGVIGLVITLWALVKTGNCLYRGIMDENDWELRVLGIGLVSGMIALLCHGFVDFNFHIPANALIFSFYLALALKVSLRKESLRSSPS